MGREGFSFCIFFFFSFPFLSFSSINESKATTETKENVEQTPVSPYVNTVAVFFFFFFFFFLVGFKLLTVKWAGL
jgi:succinate dehydrogenase/fumarate reductase cytochrome b subunit